MASNKKLSLIAEADDDGSCSECSECSDTTCILIDDDDQGSNRPSSTPNTSPASENPRKLPSRDDLVKQGVDRKILAVLDSKFIVGKENLPILKICSMPPSNPPPTNDEQSTSAVVAPSKLLATAIQQAIAKYGLSLDQKKQLFGILGWEFECLFCGQRKGAIDYTNSCFVLWGCGNPAPVHLQSGPCDQCKAEARIKKRCGDIVPYKTNAP